MHHIVPIASRVIIYATRYLAINCDKITAIYNQYWVSFHANLVEGFKHINFVKLEIFYQWWHNQQPNQHVHCLFMKA
jgi:hypothetical protein